ncbi:MAG: orotate phosphoribosyltransferase [Acidobacteria bacterium]|nr:orotate phosphoribosyltransferase [Acidobacteriota bacterium]
MDRDIARILLDLKAVSLRIDPPFTWTSGRLAPIYCDNRLVISDPARRKLVAFAFKALIEEKGFAPEVIAGTATAGIPHAAWLADLMDLPMVYVRGAAKGHGKQNRIEGRMETGKRVVLIEDLISTGGSSVSAAEGLKEAGAEVLGVLAIFTYGLDAARMAFHDAGIPLYTLTSFDVLTKEAAESGRLSESDLDTLSEWQKDPALWSEKRKQGPQE